MVKVKGGVAMSAADEDEGRPVSPRVAELLAAKGTQPLTSVGELSANWGTPDPELEEFLVSYRAERRRGFPG